MPPRPPVALLHGAVDAARDSGVSALWCIDHFTSFVPNSIWDIEFSPFAAPDTSPDEIFEYQTMLGYAAAIAPDLKLGVGVTEAIRRHPLIIAQTFLTLSHLTSSTVMIGIGAGERENTEPFGYPFERPVSRLEEALQVLRMALDSRGPFDFDGEFYQLDRAILDLAPGPGGMPEIWLAAHGPRTLRLTGTYGDGWLPTHPMSVEEYAATVKVIGDASVAAGRDRDAVTPGQQMMVATAPTRDEARALVDTKPVRLMALLRPASMWEHHGVSHPLGDDFAGVVDFIPQHYDRPTMDKALAAVPDSLLETAIEWGTADDIAERIESLTAVGLRHVMLVVVPGLAHPPAEADHSIFSIAKRLNA